MIGTHVQCQGWCCWEERSGCPRQTAEEGTSPEDHREDHPVRHDLLDLLDLLDLQNPDHPNLQAHDLHRHRLQDRRGLSKIVSGVVHFHNPVAKPHLDLARADQDLDELATQKPEPKTGRLADTMRRRPPPKLVSPEPWHRSRRARRGKMGRRQEAREKKKKKKRKKTQQPTVPGRHYAIENQTGGEGSAGDPKKLVSTRDGRVPKQARRKRIGERGSTGVTHTLMELSTPGRRACLVEGELDRAVDRFYGGPCDPGEGGWKVTSCG